MSHRLLTLFTILFLIGPTFALLAQEEVEERLHAPKPMDTEGLTPDLANILQKYYELCLGGAEHWDRIESIRYTGSLHTLDMTAGFVVYKKKPDYHKVVLTFANGHRYIMGYDGEDAWTFNSGAYGTEPQDMPETDAHYFIRESIPGSHLLYPKIEGKTIEIDGSVIVEGNRCYKVLVTLPNGDEINYMLDFGNYHERQSVTSDTASGLEEKMTFSNFKEVDGVVFPFTTVKEVEGEFVHRVEIDEVATNLGAMPWMFTRLSANRDPVEVASMPAEEPEIVEPSPFGDRDSFKGMAVNPVPSVLDELNEQVEVRPPNHFTQ